MASFGSSHLKDIDEKFCQCPICLQQYREPKQLPCLHRYCSDCLKQLIERDQGATVVTCPECRDEFTIPGEGVDGFKTDFYMKNIIEYIQIQQSLENEQQLECYGCSKKLKMASYCFKCNGFLCKECHEFHTKNKILKDHKQFAVSLEDLKSKHMTLEKLADLKEAPRCKSHPEDLCRLCCRTCDNLPICVTCTYGSHESHQIKDVRVLATEEKEKLRIQLTDLCRYNDRLLTISGTIDKAEKDLLSIARKNKEGVQIKYEKEVQMVKLEMEKLKNDCKFNQSEIENKKRRKLAEIQKQMEDEIKQLKEKFHKICEETEQESKDEIRNLKEKEEELQKRQEKLTMLDTDFHFSIKTLEKSQEEGLKKVQGISRQTDGIIERYDNLTKTGYSVLETLDDWTAMRCIPDICKSINPLSEDIKRAFLELETLSSVVVSPEITDDEGSPVYIELMKANELIIASITDGGDGSIVLTGRALSHYQSHITVINLEGKSLRQDKIKGTRDLSFRFCANLAQFKVATVCQFNDIGIYDVRDGSYFKETISDISSWPKERRTMCVTTDTVNNHILVGGHDSRDVYVFDDQLNYHHTLTLPEKIKHPHHMAVIEGYLLVCDPKGKGAYVVSMEGLEGKLVHEFTEPTLDQHYARPISVCSDSGGFIYILWITDNTLYSGKGVVVQYTQDGRQFLTAKKIYCNDSRCIVTLKTEKTEKLLVASWQSGKLHIYNLT